MTTIAFTLAVLVFEVVGIVTSLAFLFLHRPKMWRSIPAIDAAGFPLIVALVFGRSLALTVINFPVSPRGVGQAIFSLVTFAAVDGWLVVKLINFRSFLMRDGEKSDR